METRASILSPEGKLYEADKLAEDFVALSAKTKAQMSDLSVQENRQTRFISDVAHELRTPLTAIRGNAETLMDPDMPPRCASASAKPSSTSRSALRVFRMTCSLFSILKKAPIKSS